MKPIKTLKLNRDDLTKAKIKAYKRKKKIKIFLFFLGILFLVAISIGTGFLTYLYYTLPSLDILEKLKPNIITTIYADDGEIIGEFYVERRIVLLQSQIPDLVRKGIIATEDKIFYQHWGIDIKGILRAFIKNIQAGRVVQGGSTITQQLARGLFLTPEQKLIRKMREALLALQIEHKYTKDEILTLYLNQIYFGEGAYGIEAASLTYFNKHVKNLSLSETAILCGLPKAPSVYSPLKNPQKAIRRRNIVLKRMLIEGFISKKTYKETKQVPLTSVMHRKKYNLGSYFLEEIRKYLSIHYGSHALYKEGLKVYTTLNISLQKAAEKAVQKRLELLDLRQKYRPFHTINAQEKAYKRFSELFPDREAIYKGIVKKVSSRKAKIKISGKLYSLDRQDVSILIMKYGRLNKALHKGDLLLLQLHKRKRRKKFITTALIYQEPQAEAALLCLEVNTNEVKAMVGGYSFERSKFNRATQALRQVGSSFKPIVYLAAIDNGYTPSSIVIDEPTTFTDPQTHKTYSPKNHNHNFSGPVTLTTALAKSINVVAVKVLNQIGSETVIEYAKKLGITSHLNPYLSLALGTSEITLSEMTNAYAVFANAGVWRKPKLIKHISDRNGRILEQPISPVKEVVSADVAYLITHMLEATVRRGTCWRARELKRTVSAKTGTTDNYSDAWFIGYSPDYVAGAWVGFDLKKKLGREETGSRAAGPIWVDFMKVATAKLPDSSFSIPSSVVLMDVDQKKGLLYNPKCGKREEGAFIRGTEPTEYCWQP